MGLHACLAQSAVTRRPGADNCLCPASDGLIRGNEINKSRAGEVRLPQGTNVQAGMPSAEGSVPGSQGCGKHVGLRSRVSAHSGAQETAGSGQALGMHGRVRGLVPDPSFWDLSQFSLMEG